MSFLTPLALIAGLLAIPIILMYMLRLRRREVMISSTFLWQQLLKDNEANTPWQRLRRNLLLLLQLLILAALVLALARPFITVPAVGAGQIVLLLDASASMNATDVNGGSRFEEAKRQALDVVNTMSADDTMTVIRVTDVPEVIAPATSDHNALTSVINDAQPSKARADWGGALTLAIAGAANATDFNVVIISDGNLGDAALLPEVPGEVRYIPVGMSNQNVAISALATDTLSGQTPQLFTQLTNYGSSEAEVLFSLSVDGTLFTSDFLTIPAGEDLAFVSEALPEDFRLISASLSVPDSSPAPDYLAQDNEAWAVASGVGTRRVLLMTEGNLFIEQVLRSLPAIEAFKGDLERGIPAQPFDLYIFDGWLPNTLPNGDLLIVNPPRSTPLFTVGAVEERAGEIRVAQTDPRMTFVDFDAVDVLGFRAISNVDWATPLVTVDNAPLVLAGEIDGRQVAILTFDIHDSNLPLQITWPVLMSNLLSWFSPQSVISAPNSLSVGDSLVIRPPLTAESLQINLPDGTQRSIPIDRQSIIYAETDTAGIYTLDVIDDGAVTQSQPFAVNLFDPGESSIAPQSSITLGSVTITPGERDEVGQFEFWPIAALLALLILLIEWYVYHQRLRTPTVLHPLSRRQKAS
jgi:Ca-activated chloride channel homolog